VLLPNPSKKSKTIQEISNSSTVRKLIPQQSRNQAVTQENLTFQQTVMGPSHLESKKLTQSNELYSSTLSCPNNKEFNSTFVSSKHRDESDNQPRR